MHLRFVLGRDILPQQRINMRGRVRALNFNQAHVTDQPIGRCGGVRNKRMRHKANLDHLGVGEKLVSGSRLRLGVRSPLHGRVGE